MAAINYIGVRPGSRVLNTFVVLKVAAIAVLIAAGLLLPDLDPVFATAEVAEVPLTKSLFVEVLRMKML